MRPGRSLLAILATVVLAACAVAPSPPAAVHGAPPDKLTIGTMERSIHTGMSGAAVAETLGSPNAVTTDAQQRQVWTYDKIWTDTAYSKSDANGRVLILGQRQDPGVISATESALTVIIKFDAANKVRDFAYHSAQF